MTIGDQLASRRQPLKRLLLEHAVVVFVEVVEHFLIEHEVAGTDPAVKLRLLGETLDRAFGIYIQDAKSRNGTNRTYCRGAAMALVERD